MCPPMSPRPTHGGTRDDSVKETKCEKNSVLSVKRINKERE